MTLIIRAVKVVKGSMLAFDIILIMVFFVFLFLFPLRFHTKHKFSQFAFSTVLPKYSICHFSNKLFPSSFAAPLRAIRKSLSLLFSFSLRYSHSLSSYKPHSLGFLNGSLSHYRLKSVRPNSIKIGNSIINFPPKVKKLGM